MFAFNKNAVDNYNKKYKYLFTKKTLCSIHLHHFNVQKNIFVLLFRYT